MSKESIGFVGGGRITRILLTGLKKADKLPDRVLVSDPDEATLTRLQNDFPEVETACCNAIPALADLVFLAVHPPVVAGVVAEIKDPLPPAGILVSLVPKFTIAKLTDLLGGFARIARMIPNAPSLLGRGYNPVTYSAALTGSDKTELSDLLSALGEAPEVPEQHLEPYAVLTAMGPTYLWYQLYELQALGESFGLPPEAARQGVKAMVAGALAVMTESDLSAEQVRDLIPVKPLAELEPAVIETYRTKLTGLLQKIRP